MKRQITIAIGKWAALFLCVATGWGCKEVWQKSLDKVIVVLVAPGDHVVSADSVQSFYWQPVDTPVSYELVVVRPSFDSAIGLVTDTMLTGNSFRLQLAPGQYQWKVRAFNSVSTTAFAVPWTFTIK